MNSPSRTAVIGVPMLFLLAVFLLPFLLVFKISLSEMDTVFFKDVLTWAEQTLTLQFHFGNYVSLTQDDLYFQTYLSSIKFAAITTVICLLIAYPFAYFMARSPADKRPALLMLVMLPFWTSFLLRVYAWKMLLAALESKPVPTETKIVRSRRAVKPPVEAIPPEMPRKKKPAGPSLFGEE